MLLFLSTRISGFHENVPAHFLMKYPYGYAHMTKLKVIGTGTGSSFNLNKNHLKKEVFAYFDYC
jgi:hypothetical protein